MLSLRECGKVVTDLAGSALDVIYPRWCAVCRVALGADSRDLCVACRRRLDLLMAQPACWRCGHSVGPFGVDEDGRCKACRGKRSPLDGVARVTMYAGFMADLVLAFKFRGHDELDRLCSDLMTASLIESPWFSDVEALVCVPTHWRHSLRRATYPAQMLTDGLARRVDLPIAKLLRRVEGGPHQMELPRSERSANIRGKFAMRRGATVDGGSVCLVDDVSTTGATLQECARVLKGAGAGKVYAAVLGKVDTEFVV